MFARMMTLLIGVSLPTVMRVIYSLVPSSKCPSRSDSC